jgi:hypothetical protein
MISKNEILQKLQPFKNYQIVIHEDQTVDNIINGIMSTHEKYKNEYDKISEYFVGKNEYDTGKNIFNFLKANVPYFIESTKNQTLRSPSAIVSMPGDCKSYSLFANGVWDSLNRKGITKNAIAYRFADYRNIGEFQHVFSVINPGTTNEIWIDPVLKIYNEKKQPTSFKDKKIKMALIAMSGVEETKENRLEKLKNFQNRLIQERYTLIDNGTIAQGSSKDLEYKVAIDRVTKKIKEVQISGFSFDDVFKVVKSGTAAITQAGANPASDAQAFADIANLVSNLFQNKPNPNDWVGWDKQDYGFGKTQGSTVRGYILGDGDSVQNEALNIVSYINAYGLDILTKGNPSATTGDKRLAKDGKSWRDVTIAEIANKLQRGGYPQEAQAIITKNNNAVVDLITPGKTTQASSNMLLTIGLLGAGLFAISKMKK